MRQQQHPEVVVITGASAGVGRATARAFAQRGAHIGLLARGHEGLEAVGAKSRSIGGKASPFRPKSPIPTRWRQQPQGRGGSLARSMSGSMTQWNRSSRHLKRSSQRHTNGSRRWRILGFVYGTMAALRHMLPRNNGQDYPDWLCPCLS